MADIYRTSDGREFGGRTDAARHQRNLDERKASMDAFTDELRTKHRLRRVDAVADILVDRVTIEGKILSQAKKYLDEEQYDKAILSFQRYLTLDNDPVWKKNIENFDKTELEIASKECGKGKHDAHLGLALSYAGRGRENQKNNNLDYAIADFQVALKLFSRTDYPLLDIYRFDILNAYTMRAVSYVEKRKSADEHEKEKWGKAAYLDSVAIINLAKEFDNTELAKESGIDDIVESAKSIRDSLKSEYSHFSKLKPRDEPAVKQILDDLKDFLYDGSNPAHSVQSGKGNVIDSKKGSKKGCFSLRNIIILFFLVTVGIPMLTDVVPLAITYVKEFIQKSWQPSADELPSTPAVTATVTANTLNLRAEPNSNARVVKSLQRGDKLTVTGETQNGWTPVEHEGDKGYVSAEFIENE